MKFSRLLHRSENYEIKKYFNEIASQWDTMSKEFYSEVVRKKIVSMVNPEPGDIIADIGAGTGFITEKLKNSPASIVAIDQSAEMLRQMRLKFRESKNINYYVGDASHLPAKDNFFDYALANMYLHHVDDPQKAIMEIYRILNKKGMMILTDLDAHDFEFLKKEHHDKWLGFEHMVIENWMVEAGFKNVSVDSIEEYCCENSVKPGKNMKISIFLAKGEK